MVSIAHDHDRLCLEALMDSTKILVAAIACVYNIVRGVLKAKAGVPDGKWYTRSEVWISIAAIVEVSLHDFIVSTGTNL